ncbi:MAG TPA: acyl-CoA dehydrogenase family protein [Candidatus Dormibacteraeota bacterium]|nr:acyl-CoA dehydrogenase family protein [Candidatus Dormibacteraeota bacterium]
MNLVLGEEQEELQATVRRFLADRSPMARVREAMASPAGHDPALWQRMAEDLGLPGLAVPDAFGGAGLGQVELSVVMEELGAALTPSPFLASAVLAADALLATDDDEAKRDLLPGIADGTTIATLAVAEDGGGWDPDAVRTRAELDDDGVWALTGTKTLVPDGADADLLLVAARAGDELGLFAVAGNLSGLTRTTLAGLDPTRRLARLELAGTPARRLVCEDGAGALAHALDLAAVALAAEQLGGLQRCLDMSVDYAKARYQFGRPIGSFQAIKHLCADMHVAMELCRSAVRYAAWAADEAPDELPVAAALARSACSEAFFQVAADTIQVHGGIGFTWEHDAHLYYRRAKSSELLLGGRRQQRAALADRLAI